MMKLLGLFVVLLVVLATAPLAGASPEGQITWAVLVHEKAMAAPMSELAFINGVARRIEESGLGLIASYAFSAPYEDLKLKTK